ncbi:MAG: phenylacetate-CoA oxygenase subunit PaaI [Saprospiraceae bacterium]|nr:phenylacetate-CoA oxygenase subunit PaaI [Saprospiraceae bacterium]
MKDQNDFIKSLFVHADTALLLGQRLGELCGHGPVIEQDIAMTNIALDYVGRSRLFFNLISQIENNQKTEDDYAF